MIAPPSICPSTSVGLIARPDVVDLHHLLDDDLTGLVVDLDLRDAGGVRDRRVRLDLHLPVRVVHVGERLQGGRRAADQLAVVVGRRAGDVGDADLLLRGALGSDDAVRDLEICRVDLELLRCDVEDSLAHPFGGEPYGVAADERAAGCERAGADGGRVGVRVVHRHPVVGHAQGVGDDLRVDGLRALPDVDRACEDVDASVRLELDPGLARVAVLVHARRVLDRREPATAMLCHQASSPSSRCCATRCSGSRSPVRGSRVIAR